MKNTLTTNPITTITFLVMASASLLTLPAITHAAQELVPVEGANYNVSDSMSNNLRLLRGKKVNVTLDSGNTMSGVVKDVGDKLVHIEKLDGKEYFDGLVRIDSIDAIDIQFRTYKR